jgi:hypothetical protein
MNGSLRGLAAAAASVLCLTAVASGHEAPPRQDPVAEQHDYGDGPTDYGARGADHRDGSHRRHHRHGHRQGRQRQGMVTGGTATTGSMGLGTPPASAPDPTLPGTPLTPPAFQAQVQAYVDATIPGSSTALTWHFSELVPDAVQYTDLGGTDCRLYLGIVRDPGPIGGVDQQPVSLLNYRIFSGTTINCATPANVISAGSAVQYCSSINAADCTSDSPNWYNATAASLGTLTNTYGYF